MDDCCNPKENMKGGKHMDKKNLILWIVIGILVLSVIYVVFFNSASSGNAISAGQTASRTASNAMVGGC